MCGDAQVKKRRFFGDGETFGDGGAWVYLGDTAEDVAEAVRNTLDNGCADDIDFECRIEVRMMTDQEIEALPEI